MKTPVCSGVRGLALVCLLLGCSPSDLGPEFASNAHDDDAASADAYRVALGKEVATQGSRVEALAGFNRILRTTLASRALRARGPQKLVPRDLLWTQTVTRVREPRAFAATLGVDSDLFDLNRASTELGAVLQIGRCSAAVHIAGSYLLEHGGQFELLQPFVVTEWQDAMRRLFLVGGQGYVKAIRKEAHIGVLYSFGAKDEAHCQRILTALKDVFPSSKDNQPPAAGTPAAYAALLPRLVSTRVVVTLHVAGIARHEAADVRQRLETLFANFDRGIDGQRQELIDSLTHDHAAPQGTPVQAVTQSVVLGSYGDLLPPEHRQRFEKEILCTPFHDSFRKMNALLAGLFDKKRWPFARFSEYALADDRERAYFNFVPPRAPATTGQELRAAMDQFLISLLEPGGGAVDSLRNTFESCKRLALTEPFKSVCESPRTQELAQLLAQRLQIARVATTREGVPAPVHIYPQRTDWTTADAFCRARDERLLNWQDALRMVVVPELRDAIWLEGQPRDEKGQVVLFCAESVPRYLAHTNTPSHALAAGCGDDDGRWLNGTHARVACVSRAGVAAVLAATAE
jgi:hypothetical protein